MVVLILLLSATLIIFKGAIVTQIIFHTLLKIFLSAISYVAFQDVISNYKQKLYHLS